MPCGPLQAMWIVALATANLFSGALSMFMFMFSLGTVPLMLGLGSSAAFLWSLYVLFAMTRAAADGNSVAGKG